VSEVASHTPRLEPFRPTPPDDRLPAVLRDPVRLVLLAAGLVLFVASALPWTETWLPGHGFEDISSFQRSGDGAITLVLGMIVAALAWADRVAETRIPGLVVLPVVLGLASLALVKFGYDQSQGYIASLAGGGGYGYMLPGFYLSLAAAGVTVVAGAIHVARVRHEVSYRVSVTAETLLSIGSGVVGAIVGIGAAVVIGEDFSSNPTVTGSAVTFLSILLGLVGAWLGTKIGRAFLGGTPEDGSS
jgi:hypothetical protein